MGGHDLMGDCLIENLLDHLEYEMNLCNIENCTLDIEKELKLKCDKFFDVDVEIKEYNSISEECYATKDDVLSSSCNWIDDTNFHKVSNTASEINSTMNILSVETFTDDSIQDSIKYHSNFNKYEQLTDDAYTDFERRCIDISSKDISKYISEI